MASSGDDNSQHSQHGEATATVAEPRDWRGPQIKLNKFNGSRQEFRSWRNEVQAILKLHSVPADKQVLLLYLALEEGKGRPRDLFSALSVDEVGALEPEEVWKRLNK